ncbi:MAG: hypothetical protein ACI9OU_001467 [Candidatus Promineifilaceae bacterium]|jgi:hypothetical protein
MLEWFKKRWGLKSAFQVVIVLIVFSVTGSTLLYVRQPVYDILGITETSPRWLKIVLCIPLYQIMLLFWGAIFGQARFFWEFEKKSFRRMIGKRGPAKPNVAAASE